MADKTKPKTGTLTGKLLRKVFRAISPLLTGTAAARNPLLRKVRGAALGVIEKEKIPECVKTPWGDKIYLDKKDALSLSLRPYEMDEVKIVQHSVCPGDTVVDVGAHIGYFTLLLCHLVGPSGHVYSFEPSKENFALLSKNVNANSYTNVTLVSKAVAMSSGLQRFNISPTSSSHTLVSENVTWADNTVVDIETTSLDDFFRDIPVKFVKIDAEGHDFAILKGAASVVKNHGIKILSEYFPDEKTDIETWFAAHEMKARIVGPRTIFAEKKS